MQHENTDDEMEFFIGVGERLERRRVRERYSQRGDLLCSHMRGVKKAYGKRVPTSIAEHVKQKIESMNANHAVVQNDVICVEEKRPVRVRGSGLYRRWLPQALQRVCWGRRPAVPEPAPRQRVRRKQRFKKPVAAPTASSAKAWSALVSGSFLSSS